MLNIELERLQREYKLLTQEEQPVKLLLCNFVEFYNSYAIIMIDLKTEDVIKNYINYLRIKIKELEPIDLQQKKLWK